MFGSGEHAYLWHPKEWGAWIFLFVTVVSIRISQFPLFRASGAPRTFHHFESCSSPYDVSEKLFIACAAETQILCPRKPSWSSNADQHDRCVDEVWGYPFGTFLGILDQDLLFDDSLSSRTNCSLTKQLGGRLAGTFFDSEKETLIRLLRRLFTNTISRGSHKTTEIRFNMAKFQIQQAFCLLDSRIAKSSIWKSPGQEPSWNEIFLSEANEWTSVDILELMEHAINEILDDHQEKNFSMVDSSSVSNEVSHRALFLREKSTTTALPFSGQLSASSARVDDLNMRRRDVRISLEQLVLAKIEVQNSIQLGDFSFCHEYPIQMPDNSAFSKGTNQLFLYYDVDDRCMLQHLHASNSILNPICAEAMSEAPGKLRELQLERSGFVAASHILIFCVNVGACLGFLQLFSFRKRMERRLDRSRDRLQKELNDPFLRKCIENKAQHLDEEERVNFLSRLEEKVVKWDSKATAGRMVVKQVRRFRLFVLMTIFLISIAYSFLHIFHISSLTQYLEIVSVSFGMLSASYLVNVENQKEVEANEIA